MRDSLIKWVRKNEAEMETTFTSMREANPENEEFPDLSEFDRGALRGKYEQLLETNVLIQAILDAKQPRWRRAWDWVPNRDADDEMAVNDEL